MIDKEKIEEITSRYGAEVSYKEKGCGGIIPETSCVETNKFEHFTDDELYILKRQAIESSCKIVMSGKYNDYEGKIHNQLMNEIKRRENNE